jgi:hypothetical protein
VAPTIGWAPAWPGSAAGCSRSTAPSSSTARRRLDDHHHGAAVRVVMAEDNVLLSTGLEMLLNRAGFDIAAHKHIGNIFAKLGLAVTDSGHRRVLAVLTYLDAAGTRSGR